MQRSTRTRRVVTQHHVMVYLDQKLACVTSRSATLPRPAHLLTYFSPSDWISPSSPGRPQPPPPGVSILSRSPLPIRTVAFPPRLISRTFDISSTVASPSSSRPCLTQILRPSPPCPPPSRPYGARVRRYEDRSDFMKSIETKSGTSERIDTCNGSKNSSSRITPSPPEKVPAPAELSRKPKVCTSTGYRRSSISTSPIRVFVICVWTPDVPCQFGPAPEPPAIVYIVHQHLHRERYAAGTCLVVTPTCDCATLAVFTTRTERKIVRAPLTGGTSMECSQHNVYDAL